MHFFLMYTDAQQGIFSANDNIAQALLLSSFTHTLHSLGGEARGNFVKKENNNDIAFGDKTNTPAISRKADTDVRATSLVMHGGERGKQRSNHLQHFMLGGYTRRLSWLALRRRYQFWKVLLCMSCSPLLGAGASSSIWLFALPPPWRGGVSRLSIDRPVRLVSSSHTAIPTPTSASTFLPHPSSPPPPLPAPRAPLLAFLPKLPPHMRPPARWPEVWLYFAR